MILVKTTPARAQYGVVLSGAGPINRSMAGTSTAPLDASGALYWNPATISGLARSEMEIGVELLYPQTHLSSSVPANSSGFGIPPVSLSGSDRSDSGLMPIPTMGLVYQPQGSPWTYGLGFFAAGGFSVNYPASGTNPILTPQFSRGLGVGPISADLQVYQIVPTASLQVTDNLSIGFSPTVSMAYLRVDPFFVAVPDDANGDGSASFPSGTHTHMHWGLGFQVGLYYRTDNDWHLGASLKSPQWFETFRFQGTNELGQPRSLRFCFDYPMMISLGTAYTGFEGWTLGLDCRFIDYRNTRGFDESGYAANGAVQGLGWNSIFVIALGAQYQVTENFSARLGYSFNTNPIDPAETSFNVASPLILQHSIYTGASYAFTDCFLMSLAYAHAFENSSQGPIITPLGPIPGSSVQNKMRADTIMLGATVRF